ncbi:hypothetical protein [Methylotuvimicrobium sp.]|uniref:hypothetical protein n=1 Tax=Methylotuvimicrobium sp. TaxID=2822413 RepID=UPI003D65344C
MKDPRIDRLYDLLPFIYRMRDSEEGYPLKALLQIVAEQVNLVEDDIRQLYENWFIETCDDWVVPYLGDLIGYQPSQETRELESPDPVRDKILIPRREVANTIRYRRRKGTLALLELLSNDVAGWPARAVEFYRLLAWTQALNYQHLDRAKTVDIGNSSALDAIGGPFDAFAHSVDVRRINSGTSQGLYNIPSIGVFVWRLKSYSVTKTPAYCQQSTGNHCFTFSVLGNDSPLYLKPEPETDPTHIADRFNLPVPMGRRLLKDHKNRLYGVDKSLQIWLRTSQENDVREDVPIPPERIIAADLSAWRYTPPSGYVAVDPELGRIAFPSRKPPGKSDVLVKYHYGFSSELGGGEYRRQLRQPADFRIYRVGNDESIRTINEAISLWRNDQLNRPQEQEKRPRFDRAVIEITDSGLYEEDFEIALKTGESLQIRAANGKRPVIALSDKHRGRAESFSVQLARGSCLTLDGLLIVGRPVEIADYEEDADQPSDSAAVPKLAEIMIRHSTLVPGWEINADCRPLESTMPSLRLWTAHLCVKIDRSIIGSIEVDPSVATLPDIEIGNDREAPEDVIETRCQRLQQAVRLDPIRICISDSILDATGPELEAIGTPDCTVGLAVLNILRSTVFGQVQVHAVELAENTIFIGRMTVARRQSGCMRFCYVPPDSRTPRRYQCQPDLVIGKITEDMILEAQKNDVEPVMTEIEAAQYREAVRVRPLFNSMRYGTPIYCQLAGACAEEIKQGADDRSEIGVFHHLYQPQRMANLRVRLNEYTVARMDVGIILSS